MYSKSAAAKWVQQAVSFAQGKFKAVKIAVKLVKLVNLTARTNN